MSAAVTFATRRLALTLAVGGRRDRDPEPIVRMPATVDAVPMDPKTRASVAGKASAEAKTPEQREESARHAARAAHTPIAYANKLAARFAALPAEEQAEQLPVIRRALREAGIIR